jgi:hypothetical protein
MGPKLEIGQTCCYWSTGATKPLAAICMDMDNETGKATLQVFTIVGGRFTKTCDPKMDPTSEGWAEVGQSFR